MLSHRLWHLAQAPILGPGALPVFQVIATNILSPVVRPLDHHRSAETSGGRPILPHIAFLTGNQMQRRLAQHFLENLLAENRSIHHPAEHPLLGPFDHLTAALDHVEKR
jgi:hypothetical protein